MYNILIVSGGSGSRELQKGLFEVYGYGNINLNILINAYDDGKSTGACRRIADGKLLGVSDLRKNQILQYEFKFFEKIGRDSKEKELFNLFKVRYSATNWNDYYNQANQIIDNLFYVGGTDKGLLKQWVKDFFYFKGQPRATVLKEKFYDFSLANIFYSAVAINNGYSLENAAKIMADFLEIPNNVFLVSNVNLYLKGITQKGKEIPSEAEIVSYRNAIDPIEEVKLVDINGNEYVPTVDEASNEMCVKKIINDADIIVLSAGTQWSSLIPTYMHKGFSNSFYESSAKKYLVMNNEQDDDMWGISADEIINTVEKYIELKNVKIIVNKNADDLHNQIKLNGYSLICDELSEKGDKRHNSTEIVRCIMDDFFEYKTKDKKIFSDLDGTLWIDPQTDKQRYIVKENMGLFHGIIITGNNVSHVYNVISDCKTNSDVELYCDYGNSYLNKDRNVVSYMTHDYCISEDEYMFLNEKEEYRGKIAYRGEAVVTIKPICDREKKIVELIKILGEKKYKIRVAGKTSVDIMRSNYSKLEMLYLICEIRNICVKDVVYIGNELKSGNEYEIGSSDIECVEVKDIYETYVFIKTLHK